MIVRTATGQSGTPAQQLDIGRCINEALAVYKKNLLPLVLGAFLFDLLGILSLTVLIGPLAGGWCLMTINAMRRADKRVELSDMFGAFDRGLPLMGLFYLTFFPILIGLILCVIPGLLLMTIWIFCYFLMVDRREGVLSSLSMSKEIVARGGFGNYFLLAIIIFALTLAPSAIPYVGIVLAWFLNPIAWLINASAYLQEVDEKKPPVRKPKKTHVCD